MKISKNNIEIDLNEKITKLYLDENDIITISEYVRYFTPKLSFGALVLEDNEKEIHIENITNVINTTNALVEFKDCLIDSMDELFELIKHSLGSEFHVDIQHMMNEDDGAVELAIFDVLNEHTSIEDQNVEDKLLINEAIFEEKENLLIVISTTNNDNILNFPMIYSDLAILKGSWNSIKIMFWGSSINCIINNTPLIRRIEELQVSGIEVNYYDTLRQCINNEQIEEIGIHHDDDGDEFVTNALKSKEWIVMTV